MKFHRIKGKPIEEIDETVDMVLKGSLRETMDVVADLYLEEGILINYFKDGNGDYQASFKDLNLSSPFTKGAPYIYIPLYRHNEDDKPMCVTYGDLNSSLIDMLYSVCEHIERRDNGYGLLPKIREGDKTRIDNKLVLQKSD